MRSFVCGNLRIILCWALILPFLTIFFAPDAEAVSQFSRKYKVACTTCHSSFPRLNFFGEKFMLNGYQWPGEAPDGDKKGKEEISEDLFIDQVGNWLGARLSLTPFKLKTNGLLRNGNLQSSVDLGNVDYLQFFVAGSIFKNTAVFIEQEFTPDGATTAWFNLKFTNIFDTSLINFQVGRLSPVDFTPYSDRVRIFQKSDVMNVKASNGLGDNSIDVRSPRPGIQYFGYTGPFVLFAGADNGKDASDTKRDKNLWGGMKLVLPDTIKSPITGSSIGFHSYFGTNTANTSISQIENNFRRYTISANLRYKEKFDMQFVYQIGEEDNFNLTTIAARKDFTGFTATGAYWANPWYFVLQYDQIDSSDIRSIELNKLTPSVWYFLRDNFNIGLVGRIDVSGALYERHEASMVIRTMF